MLEVRSEEVDVEPTKRNWWSFNSLLLMQTQNSFNDKAVQFLLVCTAQALLQIGTEGYLVSGMQYLLGALIVTPFILFAPVAGWFSDRFPKSLIIKFSSLFQIGVFSLLILALHLQSLELLVLGFFLLAIQSSVLSPAKIGIIKELVGKKNLGYASGMLEMLTILGILGGSILMSHWYGTRLGAGQGAWEALKIPMYVLLCCTPISVLGAFMVERTKVKNPKKFEMSLCIDHYRQLMNLLRRRELRLSAIGVTYFWIFGGFIQLLSVQIANEASGSADVGLGPDLANMMLVAGVGIALGCVIASVVSKIRIELGLIPIGGVIMAGACFLMAACSMLSFWFMFWMFISGIGAALFLVPVNALLQDSCEESERGDVIAANNLLNCVGGIAAVGVQAAMYLYFGWSAQLQFVILGVITVGATIYATKLLPQHVVRFVLLMLVRVVYRIKIKHDDRLPKEGGVLMVPNHITFIDAFIISAASPRPVRFLIFDEYYEKKWLAWFLNLFEAVPISRTRAKEAIQVAADAVVDGGVVCIFPEGQLTRSGSLNEIKRGFEMIARQAKCPVVPVYMDGLWGSIFSYERAKFIKKMPYRLQYGVTVGFGEAVSAREGTHEKVREVMMELSAESIQGRSWIKCDQTISNKEVVVKEGDVRPVYNTKTIFDKQSEAIKKSIIANAVQLADTPVFVRGSTIGVQVSDLKEMSEVFLVTLPIINKHSLVLLDEFETSDEIKRIEEQYQISTWVGGDVLMEKMRAAGVNQDFYHVGGQTSESSYGLWCAAGNVVAMQMPHLLAPSESQQNQIGWKENSKGRLLAGFTVNGDEVYDVFGQHVADLDGATIDTDGFVCSIN